VEIEPFHWDEGPNSELKRRKAGQALLKKLKEYERMGENYHLIGHSHGGSVIHHALLLASNRRESLPHLRIWLTVGTPFIRTKPRLFELISFLSHNQTSFFSSHFLPRWHSLRSRYDEAINVLLTAEQFRHNLFDKNFLVKRFQMFGLEAFLILAGIAVVLAGPTKDRLNASLHNLVFAFIPEEYASTVQFALLLLMLVTIVSKRCSQAAAFSACAGR
jgi:hypothetical protein